jgi:hypothetical protein
MPARIGRGHRLGLGKRMTRDADGVRRRDALGAAREACHGGAMRTSPPARRRALVLLALAPAVYVALAACGPTAPYGPAPTIDPNQQVVQPEPPPEPTGPKIDPSAVSGVQTRADAGATDAAPATDGGRTCTGVTGCGQGELCQGPEGCTTPWTCGPSRPCTRDLAQFCGCNGVTFQGSSSCPPQPYKHKGPCNP